MSNKQNQSKLIEKILQIVKEEEPETVEQLAQKVLGKDKSVAKAVIIDQILQLQSDGLIAFNEPENPPVREFSTYLRNRKAYWYWTVVFTAIITVLSILAIPDNVYPFVYIRYFFGVFFVLLLPGYSFIRMLFPEKRMPAVISKDMDFLLRLALGFGIGLALVPITGLALSFTPLGWNQASIVLTLFSFTSAFATLAVFREFESQLEDKP